MLCGEQVPQRLDVAFLQGHQAAELVQLPSSRSGGGAVFLSWLQVRLVSCVSAQTF